MSKEINWRKRFICRCKSHWLDGWRYGDYNQFICKRGGAFQCTRSSALDLFWVPSWFGISRIMVPVGPPQWEGPDGTVTRMFWHEYDQKSKEP